MDDGCKKGGTTDSFVPYETKEFFYFLLFKEVNRYEQKLEALKSAALSELAQADTPSALNELRVKYMGKKGR